MMPPENSPGPKEGAQPRKIKKRKNLTMLREQKEQCEKELIEAVREANQVSAENKQLQEILCHLEEVMKNMTHTPQCLSETTDRIKMEEGIDLVRDLPENLMPPEMAFYEDLLDSRACYDTSSPPSLEENNGLRKTPLDSCGESLHDSFSSPNDSPITPWSSPYLESPTCSLSSSQEDNNEYNLDSASKFSSNDILHQWISSESGTASFFSAEESEYHYRPPEKYQVFECIDQSVLTLQQREAGRKTPPPSIVGWKAMPSTPTKLSNNGGRGSVTGGSKMKRRFEYQSCKMKRPQADPRASEEHEDVLSKLMTKLSVDGSCPNAGPQGETTVVEDLACSLKEITIKDGQSKSGLENSTKETQNSVFEKNDTSDDLVIKEDTLGSGPDQHRTDEIKKLEDAVAAGNETKHTDKRDGTDTREGKQTVNQPDSRGVTNTTNETFEEQASFASRTASKKTTGDPSCSGDDPSCSGGTWSFLSAHRSNLQPLCIATISFAIWMFLVLRDSGQVK